MTSMSGREIGRLPCLPSFALGTAPSPRLMDTNLWAAAHRAVIPPQQGLSEICAAVPIPNLWVQTEDHASISAQHLVPWQGISAAWLQTPRCSPRRYLQLSAEACHLKS